MAQTWVPCRHRSVLAYGGGLKKSCSSFDGSCMGQVCMSTSDVSFYVIDAHMWGFRQACAEHHLQKGQGVAGKAFASQSSCFCADITQFSKTEYPLVHYARMFGVTSCFAICLSSTHTGNDNYILEFFLPPNITDAKEQKTLLDCILETIKQHLQSLKVASGRDLEEELSVEFIKASMDEELDLRLEYIKSPQSIKSPPSTDALPNEGDMGQLDSLQKQLMMGFDVSKDGGKAGSVGGIQNSVSLSENKDTKKTSERKRGKTEKTISLEVLQQYFSGSLKDAAKSLGVCPTTMKRICRQHGISRWPSRKINKVNRSLTKLKRVIESVQGADGTFGLTSLATSPLPVAVGSISWAANTNGPNQQNSQGFISPELHGTKNGSPECRREAETGIQILEAKILGQEGCNNNANELPLELNKGPKKSKTASGSREASAGSPTSHGSCQGSPANEATTGKDLVVPPNTEQHMRVRCSIHPLNQITQEPNLMATYSIPDLLVAAQPEEPFGGMPVEDAGSSKDLRNLCPSVADALIDERVPEYSWTNPPMPGLSPKQAGHAISPAMLHFTSRQDLKTLIIKATYREDIIRFRISLTSGIVELMEEIAKRLKLDVGTFDIKYLDDDQEWVLIACDADLQECLDISRSSGSNMIRLSVHDITANLGSSCESTGE